MEQLNQLDGVSPSGVLSWTVAGSRCKMADSSAVPPLPRAALDLLLGDSAMTSHRLVHRWFSLSLIILVFAASASAEWKESVLYSFQGGSSDGSVPAGGVVFDKAGNLYGADTSGGSASCAPIGNECGTVFELTPPNRKGSP